MRAREKKKSEKPEIAKLGKPKSESENRKARVRGTAADMYAARLERGWVGRGAGACKVTRLVEGVDEGKAVALRDARASRVIPGARPRHRPPLSGGGGGSCDITRLRYAGVEAIRGGEQLLLAGQLLPRRVRLVRGEGRGVST